MALEFPLPPVPHQFRQRNAYWTNALALAAKGRGVRKMAGLFHADQTWRQHRSHGPRIDPAVGVAANGAVDGTVIHAGRATNTAQHVLKLGADHGGTAI